MPHMKPKKSSNRKIAWERSVEKLRDGGRGWGMGLTTLSARYLTLNSDAAPRYKYILGQHMGP